MDFMPFRLNFSSLTCSICALAAIILQLVATKWQKLHMVDSPIEAESISTHVNILKCVECQLDIAGNCIIKQKQVNLSDSACQESVKCRRGLEILNRLSFKI